jgi:hypothetical protein
MRDELRAQVDIHIPHGHHLTGLLEAAFDLDIGQGAIPGQVNLACDKGLYQGIVVSIQDPIERDAVPLKVRLQAAENADIRR